MIASLCLSVHKHLSIIIIMINSLKPHLHCHDFGHDGATTHPDLSSRDASAWVVVAS